MAEPTQGAMRAVWALNSMRDHTDAPYITSAYVPIVAETIDAETGLPELVAACERAAWTLEQLRLVQPGKGLDNGIECIRAALAKVKGTGE